MSTSATDVHGASAEATDAPGAARRPAAAALGLVLLGVLAACVAVALPEAATDREGYRLVANNSLFVGGDAVFLLAAAGISLVSAVLALRGQRRFALVAAAAGVLVVVVVLADAAGPALDLYPVDGFGLNVDADPVRARYGPAILVGIAGGVLLAVGGMLGGLLPGRALERREARPVATGPAPSTEPTDDRLWSPSGGMKTCPDCAEEVKVEAKLCRFCRHEF